MSGEHIRLEIRMALRGAWGYAALLLVVGSILFAAVEAGGHATLRPVVWLAVVISTGIVASDVCAREARQDALRFRKRLPGTLTSMLLAKMLALAAVALLLALAVAVAAAIGAEFRGEEPGLHFAQLPALAGSGLAFACCVAMLAIWLGASALIVPAAIMLTGFALQPLMIEHLVRPWALPGQGVQVLLAWLAVLMAAPIALLARRMARFGVARSSMVLAPAFVAILGSACFAVAPYVEDWDVFEWHDGVKIHEAHVSSDASLAWLRVTDWERKSYYTLRLDLQAKRYRDVDASELPLLGSAAVRLLSPRPKDRPDHVLELPGLGRIELRPGQKTAAFVPSYGLGEAHEFSVQVPEGDRIEYFSFSHDYSRLSEDPQLRYAMARTEKGFGLCRVDLVRRELSFVYLPGTAQIVRVDEGRGILVQDLETLTWRSWSGEIDEVLFPCPKEESR